MKIIFSALLIIGVFLSSCKKETKVPENNSVVTPQPSINISTAQQVSFSIGGVNSAYTVGIDSMSSQMSSSICLLANPHYAYYTTPFFKGTDINNYKILFKIGKLVFTAGSFPSTTEFTNFLTVGTDYGIGSYPMSNGVDISWRDANGVLWNSYPGGTSGYENGCFFKLIERIKVSEDSWGIYYKVKYQFKANLYEVNNTQGVFVTLDNGILIADHYQQK